MFVDDTAQVTVFKCQLNIGYIRLLQICMAVLVNMYVDEMSNLVVKGFRFKGLFKYDKKQSGAESKKHNL